MGSHGSCRSFTVLLQNGAGNSRKKSTDIASARYHQSQHQINHVDSQKPIYEVTKHDSMSVFLLRMTINITVYIEKDIREIPKSHKAHDQHS